MINTNVTAVQIRHNVGKSTNSTDIITLILSFKMYKCWKICTEIQQKKQRKSI